MPSAYILLPFYCLFPFSYAFFPWGSSIVTIYGNRPLYAVDGDNKDAENTNLLQFLSPEAVMPLRLFVASCNGLSHGVQSVGIGSGGSVHIIDPTAPATSGDSIWLGRSVSRAGTLLLAMYAIIRLCSF